MPKLVANPKTEAMSGDFGLECRRHSDPASSWCRVNPDAEAIPVSMGPKVALDCPSLVDSLWPANGAAQGGCQSDYVNRRFLRRELCAQSFCTVSGGSRQY